MGAGASSAVLVMRDAMQVPCANAAFDGLQDIANSPKPCSCQACRKTRAGAINSPAMDTHDAYTLTTAMRVIERSSNQLMPDMQLSQPSLRPQGMGMAGPPPSAPRGAWKENSKRPSASVLSADLAGAQAAASAVLRRRAGIDDSGGIGDTPLGKENLPPHGRRAPPAALQSPVFEDSPTPKVLIMEASPLEVSSPFKPAMEAYSRKVVEAAVNHKARNASAAEEPNRQAPARHGRRAGKLMPLQLCKPDFTACCVDV